MYVELMSMCEKNVNKINIELMTKMLPSPSNRLSSSNGLRIV